MPKEVITLPGNPDTEPQAIYVGWDNNQDGPVSSLVSLGTIYPQRNEQTPRGEGVIVKMNRQQINALIRHLRNARDGSFGRDE